MMSGRGLLGRMFAAVCGAALAAIGGCAGPGRQANLGAIYNRTAESIGAARNPVIVIPGILGSRLVEPSTGRVVWGAFTHGAVDSDFPEGARTVALPMAEGVRLRDLRDAVEPDGVLDSLEADVGPLRVTALEPYKAIIESLAAGRYVDRDVATRGAGRRASVTGGDVDFRLHFTCFQFDYDWRRDLSEHAVRLDVMIKGAQALTRQARAASGPVKVDVVAHSMGGLVLMYYLRYGTQPLPDDGSLPPITWAGAANVERAVLVGTPSAGSVLALRQLVEGVSYSPITPTYQPAVLCTMPAIYDLLPRVRHARVVEAGTRRPVDFLDASTWERFRWGPADPRQAEYLGWLLPGVPDPAVRRRIALEHLRTCLRHAAQLHAALDTPSTPPEGLELVLFAGDSEPTPSVLEVDPATGRLRIGELAPGDGTVTRASALLDERLDGEWSPRLRTPVRWSSVRFLAADHIALTAQRQFTDDLLWMLLERPPAQAK